MSSAPSPHPPHYRIELAPEAWRAVGRVHSEEFLVLRDVMELLSVEGTPYEQGLGPHSITVAGFQVHYMRDDEARVLTLLRVEQTQRKPEEAA